MGIEEFQKGDDPKRFKVARGGDHLMGIPFQCDVCFFLNIHKRLPDPTSHSDKISLMVIHQANLDAF